MTTTRCEAGVSDNGVVAAANVEFDTGGDDAGRDDAAGGGGGHGLSRNGHEGSLPELGRVEDAGASDQRTRGGDPWCDPSDQFIA